MEMDISRGQKKKMEVYRSKCYRIFRYDDKDVGMEQLWGQAVCTTCIAILSIWTDSNRNRKSGDCTSGYVTRRKWWGDILEMVWIWQQGEWCACFASWCADQCGYIESGVIPKFAKCDDGVNWFRNNGQFQDGSYTPAAGDFIFFDWGNDGSIDHVRIVENTVDGVVHTIEGNSSNAVNRRSYSIGKSSIYGYGVPIYKTI